MAERAQVIVRGGVQGVGFRPFVYNLARRKGLAGSVSNTSGGVLIDIEGPSLDGFLAALRIEAPPLARITEVSVTFLPVAGFHGFSIEESVEFGSARPFTLVSSDVSVCPDCLRELLDPGDRRYLYPFINCTNCGPRYTITQRVPYDRPNTTMSGFAMCVECQREYYDPGNRRFHAQPNACPVCGPDVEFGMQNSERGIKGRKAFEQCIAALHEGKIIAIKGLGGFHIACDAENPQAVSTLRERKRKSNKPFAVMCPDASAVREYCTVSDPEREMLETPQRPIVLLEKRLDRVLPEAVSPNNRHLGVMLPYTPLHQLLFIRPQGVPRRSGSAFKALVMTSGNLAEEPIVRTNEEALEKFAGIVDGFLLHDRDIFMRVDDSVVRVRSAEWGTENEATSAGGSSRAGLQFIRRSRGYAPEPVLLRDEGPEVLGCGADLKNTFTLTKGCFAIPSQHIGDMENFETLRFYEECLENLKQVYRAEPVAIVHDLHPGYLSTKWAIEQGARGKDSHSAVRGPRSAISLYAIQHHYAHIGAVMAEHGISGKVIGVAFDGTGYGTDGNLWGGEFLVAGIGGFERAGQFKYIPLPGGEAAIREPWRTAVSFIAGATGEGCGRVLERIGFREKFGTQVLGQVLQARRSPELSPLASGAGRLFDAVSSILGLCHENTFEGEAAIALEAVIQEGVDDGYAVEMQEDKEYTVIDFSLAIRAIISERLAGISRGVISAKFHNTVSTVIETMAQRLSRREGIGDVALSGGTFQNLYLLTRVVQRLSAAGLNVYTNRAVPCNDACISLGQAYIVRERLKIADCRLQTAK